MKKMTYAGVGVDYDAMDPFKRLAQLAGRKTAKNMRRLGLAEAEMSRGESAYLIEADDCYLAQVEEGLGTKNLVADAMYLLTGKSYYDQIAQDAVAMIVNDLITLGALPVSVAMHLAVGDSNWFNDKKRCRDLIKGWRLACDLSGCAWGGGETPTLKGVVDPQAVVLSGSAVGIIKPKKRLIAANIQDGDAIILVESSGIHANGLTLARKIAARLSGGYLTELSDGRTYGESLLDPTVIYVALVEKCLNRCVDIHYAVNITGHGWRKLMRATQPFTYVVSRLPRQLPIFDFIQKHGPVDNREAFGNLNMGAGFALYVPVIDVENVLYAAKIVFNSCPSYRHIQAIHAGYIEKSRVKRVIIEPKNLKFSAHALAVR